MGGVCGCFCGWWYMVVGRMHIYIRNEEILKKFKAEEKRSDIINMLLEDYYSQDLEYLKQKKQELFDQQEIINLKIKNKEKQNQLIKNQEEEENKKNQEIEQRKEFSHRLQELWRENKITDTIYYKICDVPELDKRIKMLEKYLK